MWRGTHERPTLPAGGPDVIDVHRWAGRTSGASRRSCGHMVSGQPAPSVAPGPHHPPRRGDTHVRTRAAPGTRFGRVVGASVIGTTVEWYDFFLYGSAAALVFPALFFPEQSDFAGTLLSFGTYAVGFAARPDRRAWSSATSATGSAARSCWSSRLLMMGGATFAIGLLPTYGTVGVLAPILLVTLRLIQGFALGGEWGGAVLLVSEHGKPENRGFWASWPQAGAPAGNLLATGVLALLAAFQSDEAFAAGAGASRSCCRPC